MWSSKISAIIFRNINTKNNYIVFCIFIILFQIKIINGQWNKDDIIKNGSTCFNRIIRFVPFYRAGQFTIRKDGFLFIE